jgi:hypothetical protein
MLQKKALCRVWHLIGRDAAAEGNRGTKDAVSSGRVLDVGWEA